MSKKLIVCADGTWNTEGETDHGHPCPTNVIKVARSLRVTDSSGVSQVVLYIDGVGTDFTTKMRGGALGVGLFANVLKAYRWLCLNYDEGDEIHLFGFSRGAYTVRSLAGLIYNSGILRRGKAHDLESEAVQYYRDYDPATAPESDFMKRWRAENSCQGVRIRFIGVWDTVGALGVPQLSGRFAFAPDLDWQFHDVTLSPIVDHACHALAIHEHRAEFEPTLWALSPKAREEGRQTLEQVWFSGVHSDVGGGYPIAPQDALPKDKRGRLSDVALAWMMQRAEKLGGLEFYDDVLHQYDFHPNGLAAGHDSFKWTYGVLDWAGGHQGGRLREYGRKPTTDGHHNCEDLHGSVEQRFAAPPPTTNPAGPRSLLASLGVKMKGMLQHEADEWPPTFRQELERRVAARIAP